MRRKKAQNMLEIVLIIPLLLILIFGIMEYAIFQRNVNAVQDIALESAVAASKYYVDEATLPSDPFTENPAVEKAVGIVLNRVGALGPGRTFTFDYNDMGAAFGKRPFALYEFSSQKTVEYKGRNVPRCIFTIDYRDPVNEGVSTQLIYHHTLVLFGLKMQIPGGRTITLIPQNIQISSTQTRQYVHY